MKNIDVSKYEIFIFDCDGVILNSNKLKNNLFIKAVNQYSSAEKLKFEKFIKLNKGLSRYKFFEEFYLKIIKINKEEYKNSYIKSLNIYNKEINKNYIKCKYVPGVIKFIKKYQNKHMYVISGSNQIELNKLFKKKDIFKYFKKIYGSPNSKSDNASKLIKKIKSKKILYFGDSYIDYKVSKILKSKFVFISGYSDDTKLYKYKNIYKFKDFLKL